MIPADALKGKVVVVVNDEMAAIMARHVDAMGGEGVAFHSMHAARDYLSEHTEVDCAVIDLLMLDGNGSDLVRELAITRGPPTVLISGVDLETVSREAMRGVFLAKPFTAEQLAEKILLAIGEGETERPGPEANG